uniref:Envelope glycoprotein gp150 n=1 Tax=Feline immunodeficiency virus TaxID=11673 RepID=B2BWI5_9RETR|nr:envelope glycoprotein [Feline immunodeficiency virus]
MAEGGRVDLVEGAGEMRPKGQGEEEHDYGIGMNPDFIGPYEGEMLLDYDILQYVTEEGPFRPGFNPFRGPGITEEEKLELCKILQTKLKEIKSHMLEGPSSNITPGKYRRLRYLQYSDMNIQNQMSLLFFQCCFYLRDRIGKASENIDVPISPEERFGAKEKGRTTNILARRICGISSFILLIFISLSIWKSVHGQVVWRLPPIVIPIEETDTILWDCWAPGEPACEDYMGYLMDLKAHTNLTIEGPTLGDWAREIWLGLIRKATKQCTRKGIYKKWNDTITGPQGCANNSCINITVTIPDYSCYLERIENWLMGMVNFSICVAEGKILLNKETKNLQYCTDRFQIPLINYTFGPNQTCKWNLTGETEKELPQCGWWNQNARYNSCWWEQSNITFNCSRTQSQPGKWVKSRSSWKSKNRYIWMPDITATNVKVTLQCMASENLTFAMRDNADSGDVTGAWIEFGCLRKENKTAMLEELMMRIRCRWNEGANETNIDTCGKENVTKANPVNCTMFAKIPYNCTIQNSFLLKLDTDIIHFNLSKILDLKGIVGNWSCESVKHNQWGYMKCNCSNVSGSNSSGSNTKMMNCPANTGILRNWYNPVLALKMTLQKYTIVKQPDYVVVPQSILNNKIQKKEKRAAIHIILALSTILSLAGAGAGVTAITLVSQYHHVLQSHQQAIEKITTALKVADIRLIALEHQMLTLGLKVEALEKFVYTAFAMQVLGCREQQFFCKIPQKYIAAYNLTVNTTFWNDGNVTLTDWYNRTKDLQRKFQEIIMEIEQSSAEGQQGLKDLEEWESWTGWIKAIPKYLKGLVGGFIGVIVIILGIIIGLPILVDCIRNIMSKIVGYVQIKEEMVILPEQCTESDSEAEIDVTGEDTQLMVNPEKREVNDESNT